MEFSISIIYPTIGRPELLERSISALLAGSELPLEIVVVDQSDSSETAIALETFSSSLIKHVASSEKGLSRARNEGIRQAKGDYIGFIDDDCVPAANWLSEVRQAIKTHDRSVLWTGSITHTEQELEASPSLVNSKSIKGKGDPFRIGPTGGNSVFKRSIFDEIGLFDPALGQGSDYPGAEDADMVYRIIRSGHQATFSDSFRCYHVNWRSEKENALNQYNYGMGIGAMLAKYQREGDWYPSLVIFTKNFLVKFIAPVIFLLLLSPQKAHSRYMWCAGMLHAYRSWWKKDPPLA